MGHIEHNEMFFLESQEMLDNAAFIIADAEKKGIVPDVINEVFRTFHSIKGAAQMLDFKDIGDLAHMLENLLDYMRTGSIACTDSSVLSIILESIDLLQLEIYSYRSAGELSEEVKHAHNELYKMIEERVQLVNRGTIAANVSKMKVQERTEKKQAEAELKADEGERSPLSINAAQNLYYVIFVISKAASMPQVTKFLIGQRLQECAGIVCWSEDVNNCTSDGASEEVNIFELNVILQTNLSKNELKQYCNVCDVKAIYIEELSSDNVVKADIQPEDVEDLLDKLTKLASAARETYTANVNNFSRAVQMAVRAGNKFIKKYCRRRADVIEWERRVALLEKIVNLYKIGEKNLENKFLLNSLLRDMWDGIYFFVNNRSYFYSIIFTDKFSKETLEQEINAILCNANVKAIVIDIGNVETFEINEILILKDMCDNLATRGINCFVFSSGEYKRRQINIVEAVCDDNDFRIYDSLYNAFYKK